MSYFEPSRRAYERRRLGLWTSVLDWIWSQRGQLQTLGALLLAAYITAAAVLCGIGLVAGLSTGLVLAVVLTGLVLIERRAPPLMSRVAFGLVVAIGTPALLVPTIVFLAIGFWYLISLPLWLYRG